MFRYVGGIVCVAIALLWVRPGVEAAAVRPEAKGEFGPAGFLGDLDLLLRKGVRCRNDKAVTACCALLMAPDQALIDRAMLAVRLSGNRAAWRETLQFGKKVCLREERERDPLAWVRVAELGRLSRLLSDGASYLALRLYSLTLPLDISRVSSVGDLRRLHDWLHGSFGKDGAFPPKPTRSTQMEYCRGVRRQWEAWLKEADPEKVQHAMRKWFAHEAAEGDPQLRMRRKPA